MLVARRLIIISASRNCARRVNVREKSAVAIARGARKGPVLLSRYLETVSDDRRKNRIAPFSWSTLKSILKSGDYGVSRGANCVPIANNDSDDGRVRISITVGVLSHNVDLQNKLIYKRARL